MEITITRPDDWHIHLRDGDVLEMAVNHTAQQFARAIVMPNLVPPVQTTEEAIAYREEIIKRLRVKHSFQPLMTLYLTEKTSAEEIQRAKSSGIVHGIKLYPAGATTHSDAGVKDLSVISSALEAMQEVQLPLLVHGEVTDPDVDVFDRESRFIDQHLINIARQFPALKIVLEHVTTTDGVQFVMDADDHIGATITAHHLLLNRNDLFKGGLNPHHYCLPVLKREQHRRALVSAATGGCGKFFLGTDSAPHDIKSKESACGCAGIYTANAALELYADIFERENALDKLEAFASFHGPDFYGLPRNTETVTLTKRPKPIPESFSAGESTIVPLRAGGETTWYLEP